VPLPRFATPGSAGADVYANLRPICRSAGQVVLPMERVLVPAGFRVEIPAGFELQVRPRSGLAHRHGITVLNAPGTIDSDYRGPVGILIANLGQKPYTIRHGDRIAQLIFAQVLDFAFADVQELAQSSRGEGGFGSTGSN